MEKRKLLALWCSACLALVLAVLPFMLACTKPAMTPATTLPPTPAPAQAPTSSPAPTTVPAPSPAKVWELRYAQQDPESGVDSIHAVVPWIKAIDKATQGRVKVTPYWAETLAKGTQLWDAAKFGISDISWVMHGVLPGLTPLSEVMTLPFLGVPSGEVGGGVLWQLYEKFPEVKKQYAECHVLMLLTSVQNYMATTKKEVKTLEDIKGLKIRVPGGPATDMMKGLGAVPLTMPATDLYISLQKGVMDGVVFSPAFAYNFRLDELLKYYLSTPLIGLHFSVVMNLDCWNSLPPDIQEAITSLSSLKGSMWWSYWRTDSIFETFPQWMVEHGHQWNPYILPPEEMARWRAAAGKPTWDKWLGDMKAKGLPGQEVLDETLRLLKEYEGYTSKYRDFIPQ